MSAASSHVTERLELARLREFAEAGAGVARRSRLQAFGTDFLQERWAAALTGLGVDEPVGGAALAVVGSQARGDAGPLSDYDIVLLHDGRSPLSRRIGELADALWYPMWDAGVRFDHSVRTPAECRKVAAGDLSAAVGLLDIEPVAGERLLVAGVRESIAHDWRGAARQRLPELLESMRARHERFGDITTSQAPDLKEARGGLRDLSLIGALTTAWLADPHRGRLDEAHATLLDVRDAVHVVTGRGRERLTLEDQDAVAAVLGLPDSDELMTWVVDAARTVSFVVDSALRSAGQSQRARTLRVGPRRPALTPLGHGLHLHDGEVVLGAGKRVGGDVQLLRAAAAAARRGISVAPRTLANLLEGLEQPLPQPWPAPVREAFVDLLAAGPGLVWVWEALDHAGVIDRWLPEWSAVRSRPQRNAVHTYTVDRHIIETVVQAASRRGEVSRPDLLLLGALLHDIGKIAGSRDHSRDGAVIARTVLERMGLTPDDVAVVERLVAEHLSLVELATKRDPEDPATVQRLCALVDERSDVLGVLRVLTESDARAAGPQAWTGWRAGLVDELTRRATHALAGRGVVTREPGRSDIPELVAPDVLVQVLGGEVVVEIEPTVDGGTVRIIDADRPGVFADMAGVLGLRRSLVRSATVRTVGGVAVNTWRVDAPGGSLPDAADLVRTLRTLRAGDRSPVRALEGRSPRSALPHPAASARTHAVVVPGASADATVVEVRAPDRAGLLFDVGSAFARCGVSVRSAHIATFAGQSADTFYLVDAAGQVLDPPLVARVIAEVIDAAG